MAGPSSSDPTPSMSFHPSKSCLEGLPIQIKPLCGFNPYPDVATPYTVSPILTRIRILIRTSTIHVHIRAVFIHIRNSYMYRDAYTQIAS